jgi:CheY-like chemotaxis protein
MKKRSSYPSAPAIEVLRPPTVAIIDDDVELARAVARILRANYKCVVRGFASLEEFLRAIDKKGTGDFDPEDLDLILLDFHLPGRNGPRLIEELEARQSPLLERSHIMGITADTEEGIFDAFKDVGIEEIIEKPLKKLDYGRIADRAYKICSGLGIAQKPTSKMIKTYI